MNLTITAISYDRTTTAWERDVSETIFVDPRDILEPEPLVLELPVSALEQLVARSASPDGFDRDALLTLDAEAWGVTE